MVVAQPCKKYHIFYYIYVTAINVENKALYNIGCDPKMVDVVL